jgi:hypothetical protein
MTRARDLALVLFIPAAMLAASALGELAAWLFA